MPLRFDIRKKLTATSDRVKSVDLHPTEPWMVVSLYSGTIVVYNHDTQTIVKTFNECIVPVRAVKFIARKHWVVAGGDDMMIRILNYNTLARVHMFEAHQDYIRCIAVHPTQPYILTSSDDMLIKLWDWTQKWLCIQVFVGHSHYVMDVVFNPKDNNQFASASLDRTVKVWQLGSKSPNFTLEGHNKGVNCVSFYSGGDKPYIISGADDCLAKIWDYQNKTCIHTLEGHTNNISCISFYPQLPVILTGSEDGTIRVWHSNTYRLEDTLDYDLDRAWCLCTKPFSNIVALGFDNGAMVIQLGREKPAMSMDSSGKIIWARGSEVQQANLKTMGEAEVRDGEKLLLGVKDMGTSEIHPQTLQHSPNGRFVAICGDGEYIIYTAMALRNKSFGSAQKFVWSHDSSQYAIIEGNTSVKIFRNFRETTAFKVDLGATGIFGGFLLGVKSRTGLTFYDWERAELMRRIDILPKHVFWSNSGELVCIATDESFFVLRYLPEEVAAAKESKTETTQDGPEGAFEVLGEVQEGVKTGLWVGDCFIYTSSLNRLNYYVGGKIVNIAHLDRTMYLLGYIPKDNRLYLGDMELNVVSYFLVLSVLEYQTAVMRKDFSTADKVLPTIPREQRIRVAYFLEEQGFKQQALAVSSDPEHKFELALQLGDVQTAYQLASEAKLEQKWRQLAKLATTKCQFSVAQECLLQAQDYGGLLLLATASGSGHIMENLAEGAERNEKTNVAFLTYFLLGRLENCLDLLIKTDRLPEAAFLARTYLPSHVSRVVKLWKESLSKVNPKAAGALADPTAYSNLFPGLQQALVAEQYLKEATLRVRPAADYPLTAPNEKRNVLEESAGFVSTGITEPKVVARGLSEPVRGVAAATEALKEELTPPMDKITGTLSQSEEESLKTFAENMEAKQVECDERVTAGCKDFLEEVISEAAGESIPTETMKPPPLADMTSSFQSEVQMMSFAHEDVSPASETKPESIETTNGEPSKILVSVGLSACAGESLASSLSCSQAIVNMATEEICAQGELISDGSAPVVPAKESISSENTASRDSGGPELAENFAELALDPLLDPPRKQTQVMKPVRTQEQEEEEPEDCQKHSGPLGADLWVSSPDRAQSSSTNPDGAGDEVEGQEEEAELGDKSILPDDGALSTPSGVKDTVEKFREMSAMKETLDFPDRTFDVAESAAAAVAAAQTEMGPDVIPLRASLIVKTPEDETCVTDALVSDTSPGESDRATPAVDPSEQEQETQTTGLPGDSQEVGAPGAEPSVEFSDTALLEDNMTGQESQLHGSDEPTENLETELDDEDVVPVDESLASSPETIETTVGRTSDTSSPEEIFVGLDWAPVPESTAGEEMSAGEKLEADVEVLLSTDQVYATEVTDTEKELWDSSGVPVPSGPALAQTFTKPIFDPLGERTQILKPSVVGQEGGEEEETLTSDLPLEKPGEESILSENTASGDSGEPALTETFTELASDHLLDPPREQTQVMKPVGTQEQEEEEPEDCQKHSGPLGAELWVSSPDRAQSEGNTGTNPNGAGDEEEGEEEEEAELGDKSVPPNDGALCAAYGVIETVQEKPMELPETEETLVSPDWTIDASESAADRSVHQETGTSMSMSEASLLVKVAQGEIDVTQGQVADTPLLAATLEVSILSKSNDGIAPNGLAQVQTFTELTLDPLDGRTQVLEQLVAQEQEEETEATGPGDSQEPAATLGTEPSVSSPETTPSEGNTDTDVAGGSVEDEDVEAELGDKSILPDDGALSTTSGVKDTVEKFWEMSAMEETLVFPDLTSDVAESAAAAAHTEMGPDVIPLRASLIVKTPEDETCVTDARVSDTSPLVSPQEETSFSKSLIGPVRSGSDQDKTVTNLPLDPLFCPREGATPAVEPSEQEQETQTTGLPGDSQEVGAPGAEPSVEFSDTALLKDNMTGQESQVHGSDEPTENLETELDDEDVVPVDESLASSPETIETTVGRTSDTSSPEEIFVGLDWAPVPESTAGEEMSAGEKLEADVEVLLSTDQVYGTEVAETEKELLDNSAIPVPGGPALGQTFTKSIFDPLGEKCQILKPSVVGQEGGEEEETLTSDLPPEKPGEESILSENTASGDSGEPALTETFTELALDHLLDPPREQTQVMKPVGTQEQEEEEPEDCQKHSGPLGAELWVSSPDRAQSEGNTDTDQPAAEEDVDTEVDVQVLDDDEDLEDLDLEDIDVSEIDLDEELLSD